MKYKTDFYVHVEVSSERFINPGEVVVNVKYFPIHPVDYGYN